MNSVSPPAFGPNNDTMRVALPVNAGLRPSQAPTPKNDPPPN